MKTIKVILLTILFVFLVPTVYYFFPEDKLPPNTQIDNIVVYKSKRELMAYSNGTLIKTYKISLGKEPIGHKEFEGDAKTPEGVYTINNKNPNSNFYKGLGISYPNADDIANSKQGEKPTGGAIKIHGIKNGSGILGKFHRWYDWTLGCIALRDEEIDELYEAVKVGTRIEIQP